MEFDPVKSAPFFATGSLVRLKSGGPAMSVLGGNADNRPYVVCGWFWRGKYYQEEFYPYVLTDDLDAPIPPLGHERADQASAASATQPAGAEKISESEISRRD